MPRYIVIPLLASVMAAPLQAASFYKYIDADGVVTYGNQQPGAAPARAVPHKRVPAAPLYGAIEAPGEPSAQLLNRQLQARLHQDIARQLLQNDRPVAGAEGPQDYRYARPWQGNRHAISQGFNGSFSHNTAQSRYAVDIAMPEGTAIQAARSGTVLRVQNDQQGQGGSPNGNYLRILHGDGTSSAYLHLQQGSIVVKEGQRVEKGQHLGNSGNTGRSTGPHLHFVVQRHKHGRFESIPFQFDNPLPQLQNFAANNEQEAKGAGR